MAESHVVSGLVSKRSELAGLIEHHMQEIHRMDADLHHLDATIKLFNPDYDLRTVRIKQHYKKNRFFKSGESTRLVLDVLREADGAMTTEEVALTMLNKKGLDSPDKDVTTFFKKAAITALRHQSNRKLVNNTGFAPDGITLLWELV